MNNHPVQQIHLLSGEELICEVMDYEEVEGNIIIRNAMVIETNIFENNDRVYMFKPWFLYIERSTEMVMLKVDHVTASVTPNDLLLIQYYSAVNDMDSVADDRVKEHNRKEAMKLKTLVDQIANLKRKVIGEEPKKKEQPSNVIPFPTDDTIH
mgnify:CR=1 FL=1|uniref:Sm-like domain-containing protein n=1 Tax=viral metagenome TaxID=1070528 RepID=A0A6C0J3L4_9ZZZZ|tara:strand:+ start:201 stop:659 length:459 start_codon:yes stop_codon:yes gene_type:complete